MQLPRLEPMQTGQSYSTGGARSAWAARSNQCHHRDICQTPPPRVAPPAPASPSLGSWKPQVVNGRLSARQSQDLQVSVRGGEARRGLGDALVTDAQTRQTQPSLITHPCKISRSAALGETAQTAEHAAGCRARKQQRAVQHTPLPCQASSTARPGQKR